MGNLTLKNALKIHFEKCQEFKKKELDKQLKWLEYVSKSFKTDREKQAYIEGFNHAFGIMQNKEEKEIYCKLVK